MSAAVCGSVSYCLIVLLLCDPEVVSGPGVVSTCAVGTSRAPCDPEVVSGPGGGEHLRTCTPPSGRLPSGAGSTGAAALVPCDPVASGDGGPRDHRHGHHDPSMIRPLIEAARPMISVMYALLWCVCVSSVRTVRVTSLSCSPLLVLAPSLAQGSLSLCPSTGTRNRRAIRGQGGYCVC